MSISLSYTFHEVVDVSLLSSSIKIALLGSSDKCCEMLTFSQVSFYAENSRRIHRSLKILALFRCRGK